MPRRQKSPNFSTFADCPDLGFLPFEGEESLEEARQVHLGVGALFEHLVQVRLDGVVGLAVLPRHPPRVLCNETPSLSDNEEAVDESSEQ